MRGRRGRKVLLLLHSDVFLTTGQTVLQRPLTKLGAGPGLPHVPAAVLLHGDPFYLYAGLVERQGGVRGSGMGERRRRRRGERGQGEADRRRAQCLPRISKSVPLKRDHKPDMAESGARASTHIHARLIYIHGSPRRGELRFTRQGLSWGRGAVPG